MNDYMHVRINSIDIVNGSDELIILAHCYFSPEMSLLIIQILQLQV